MGTTKFMAKLTASHSKIKADRAAIIVDSAKEAQEDLVRELKKKVRNFTNQLLNLEDLAPTSTTSLKIGSGDFAADKWVAECHALKVEINLLETELEVAEATYKEYFEEEVTE